MAAFESGPSATHASAGTFEILARDGRARRARLKTPHGPIDTPTFMPVATQATVKGLTPRQVRETGTAILLANAYHLSLRPGAELIAEMGGIHRFMAWEGAVLTDSGGYQILSLAALRKVSDEGVAFRSHLDGKRISLTPESVVRLQRQLGVDILMPLDECLAAPAERGRVETALRRTTAWAVRSLAEAIDPGQRLFGIVQGGMFADLRRMHAVELAGFEFPGYAVGGLSVGEERGLTREMADVTVEVLPGDRPRYLMGVGLPQDLLRFIGMGYDLFDCVLPTRNGRNGTAFTWQGRRNLRLARYARDPNPLDPKCACDACRSFSRSYLRHLVVAREMLGAELLSFHNLHFYQALMASARAHIEEGDYATWAEGTAGAMEERDPA
jgi:queuine tRNA-ribosyltransferase